jgi:glycosyltransferase involved in cell wall biosynthesis
MSGTPRPLVSIVIPAHDHARFLPGTLESALAQTVRDVEVIVVDDGSSDGTPELAPQYADRVTWVRQPRRGPAAARNAGLALARGTYVNFLDADDSLTPDAVERRLDVLARDAQLGWVYSDLWVTDADGRVTGLASELLRYRGRRLSGDIFAELLLGDFIPIHAVLVRRAVLDAVGLFDESLTRSAEDWDLWLRVARRYPVAYLDATLGYYRRAPGGKTADRLTTAIGHLEMMAIIERRWPEDVASVPARWRRLKALEYLRAAIDRRPTLGRRDRLPWIWRAIRTRPVQGAAYRVLLTTLLHGGPRA